ncbi:carbon-nitrogen hydrolase family protein [Desulfofundulus thermosubterraneus]|uniref:Predicted amidohydrolase n=1 Tax=Desulfofundulus thermosubterraneus DSM 16057 TaxID=1121432 RepID=A0A1M6LIC8_9FIRM|nr:carbon-nitrogen hydrolase family protein [Desulfofundulus thermosubterraneus]SHJ70875.1 Predicted amidohydrolase [Desulfofundulus thermosubterraneus DSM 16057]
MEKKFLNEVLNMPEEVRVALIHAVIKWKDKEHNLRRLLTLNEEAAASGARIIVNPELATTGYTFESRRDISPFVETVPGLTTELFGALARRYGVYICLGLPEVDSKSGIYYNTAVLIGSDGRVMGEHRKLAPAFKENLWAARGNLPVLVAETCFGRVGVLICADTYWYKAARMAALKGARVLLIPANWPPHHYPPEVFWRARALENGVYVLACNRTGQDKSMNCNASQSFIIGPDGSVLKEVQSVHDTILYGTLPLKNGKIFTPGAGVLLGDRRPEFYAGITLDTFSQFEPEALLGLPAGKEFAVATVQFAPQAKEPVRNTRRILSLLDQAADLAARRGMKLDLVVFPELAVTGAISQPSQAEELAEPVPGPVAGAVIRRAEKLDLYVVMGVLEREDGQLFNTAVLIGPAGLLGKYRKIHLSPSDREWARPGQEDFCFFDLPFGRVGLLLGHDLFFPESLESLAKQGVDVLCVPALWNDEKSQFIWEARIAEQMHLVVANQWGSNGSFCALGGSLIYSYSRYSERRVRLVSPVNEDRINIMLLNPKETRQKKFLEEVDYDLLLTHYKLF